jgi:hypothetical protein
LKKTFKEFSTKKIQKGSEKLIFQNFFLPKRKTLEMLFSFDKKKNPRKMHPFARKLFLNFLFVGTLKKNKKPHIEKYCFFKIVKFSLKLFAFFEKQVQKISKKTFHGS